MMIHQFQRLCKMIPVCHGYFRIVFLYGNYQLLILFDRIYFFSIYYDPNI